VRENADKEVKPTSEHSMCTGFKLLPMRMAVGAWSTTVPSSTNVHSTVIGQLNRYLVDATGKNVTNDVLHFLYSKLHLGLFSTLPAYSS